MENKINHESTKFEFPTIWYQGRGVASRVGEIVRENGGERVLLLTDQILKSKGIISPVVHSLTKKDIDVQINATINQEPSVELFDRLIESLDLTSFDTIVAVGGGSVLDTAKGIAVIASFGGNIRDYDGFDKVPGKPKIQLITIPTTSGTGSEISDGVVLIDEARQTKFLVISKKICPDIALTDPELTLSMPPTVTAHSGVDALVHAIESYISRKSTLTTELFSLKAIKLISENLPRAYQNGEDLDAREQTQTGATMAMVAGMNAYLGLCHAMAMPLCALYKMPHGVACGMVLPVALEFNLPVVKDKIITVYRTMKLWDDTKSEAEALIVANQKLKKWLAGFQVTAGLERLGFAESHLIPLVEETMNSAQRATSPRQPSKEELREIVAELM